MRILQISNYSEGVGGISVQVKRIRDHLVSDGMECDIHSTKGGPLKRLAAIVRLPILGKKYDVFHVHACSDRGFLPAVIGISMGRLLKKRVVVTFHGGGAEAFFRRHTRLIRYFLTRTDANIVLSDFIGRIYGLYHIPFTVIHNIIDFEEGGYKERDEIAPRIISLRSFNEIYNIECTLRAFQRVQALYPDASLTLLGDGPLRSRLESFVKDNHLRHVVFTGRIPNNAIYGYLEKSDILVSSARFDNMPVSILEGFNAGLLVISSNVGGVPFMIRHRSNGLLFSSDHDEELSEQILWALRHQQEAKAMIRTGHEDVFEYSWDRIKGKLYQVYGMTG